MSTVTDWLDAAKARADAIGRAENAADDAEMAGENFAITLTPLSVHNALEASAADVPEALDALRAVLDLTGQDPLLRGDEVVNAIATALGVQP